MKISDNNHYHVIFEYLSLIFQFPFSNYFVIIFDEPLTSLDPDTRKKVLKMIKEECSQKTVLVITHDMEIVPYMDKIINITEINNQFS